MCLSEREKHFSVAEKLLIVRFKKKILINLKITETARGILEYRAPMGNWKQIFQVTDLGSKHIKAVSENQWFFWMPGNNLWEMHNIRKQII